MVELLVVHGGRRNVWVIQCKLFLQVFPKAELYNAAGHDRFRHSTQTGNLQHSANCTLCTAILSRVSISICCHLYKAMLRWADLHEYICYAVILLMGV